MHSLVHGTVTSEGALACLEYRHHVQILATEIKILRKDVG